MIGTEEQKKMREERERTIASLQQQMNDQAIEIEKVFFIIIFQGLGLELGLGLGFITSFSFSFSFS